MSGAERGVKDFLVIGAKGMAMGAADIVPGVSGGTIALITGIYEELLNSLKGLTPAALLVLFKEGPAAFWKQINGNFLFALFTGVLISIKTLATVVGWALAEHPLLVWGGFSGLIAASLFSLARVQGRWSFVQFVLFTIGTCVVVFIAEARPTQLSGEWWMLFIGGFIAICAMVLPGISGSFILLLLGLYATFLNVIETLDILALLIIMAGCASGLLVFSRFLSWLLARWYKNTLAVMLGFLLGSLYVTWPWKLVIETYVDRHGELQPIIQKNVLPMTFAAETGMSAQFLPVMFCAVLGSLLVLLVEWFSKKDETKS